MPHHPPNTIIEGDVLAGLAEIEDRSVDLIVTSPPYADARAKQYGGTAPDQYAEWYRPICRELLRVLRKPGSYILVIGDLLVDGERSTYLHDLIAAHRREGWRWHDDVCWHKPNGFPGASPGRLRSSWEHCHWFTRTAQPRCDHRACATPVTPATLGKREYHRKRYAEGRSVPSDRGTRVGERPKYASGMQSGHALNVSGDATALPRNVVSIGVLAGGGHGLDHPAAFPEALPAWFIRLLCPPNGIVLDPFLGSGTTAVAAEKEGRSWMGIERSPKYCKMAAGRIDAARLRRRSKKR